LAFKAGEAFKSDKAAAKSWTSYTTEIPAGAALNPVPLKVGNHSPAMLIRGSYLVNVHQHCNFCHTCPPYVNDGQEGPPGFMPPINAVNYMAGGKRFGDPNDPKAPISANLTPDPKNGLPGGMTYEVFRTALRTGRAHNTGRKMEAMPWAMFLGLTDTELVAIYEYLSSIPHAEPGVEPVREVGLREAPPPAASQ
jgi:hypothetical protein